MGICSAGTHVVRPEFGGQPSHPTESPWASLQTCGLTRGSAWQHKHATVVTVPRLPGPRPREMRVPSSRPCPGVAEGRGGKSAHMHSDPKGPLLVPTLPRPLPHCAEVAGEV